MRLIDAGDGKAVLGFMRDHMMLEKQGHHQVNSITPRVKLERKPADALDYKILGHIENRLKLLARRMSESPDWTVDYNALEKSLYVKTPERARPYWLVTRNDGNEEWGNEALAFLGFDNNDLITGAPEL